MSIIETLHDGKKRLIKVYHDYFTVDGTYTSFLPDKIYLKKLYKKRLGKKLDLRHPKTYTEKLNWLKLYDRRPEYTMMVDKYAVREYVKEKIGEEYLVPLLGVWDRVEDIDFDALPDQFVLKCNHDNGVIICRDKSNFDIENAKKELTFHLNRDYYKKCREWAFKNVKRKIICEKFMCSEDQPVLVDYKFYCFDGNPLFLYVQTYNETGAICIDFFDLNFVPMPFSRTDHSKNKDYAFKRPTCFFEMIKIAGTLSKSVPFLRVDLYEIGGSVYFGELTFSPGGGFGLFSPDEWNYTFGDWITLPPKRRRP